MATGQEKRREYMKAYRDAHRDAINAYSRKWRQANKDRVREYSARYWERKAQEGGINA